MHELSIAQSIVEMVEEAAGRLEEGRVTAIHLRVGALSSVVEEALCFSFELVAAGTAAEGARLTVEVLPIVVYCARCELESALPAPTFCCPSCGTPTADIRQGRELELAALEVA